MSLSAWTLGAPVTEPGGKLAAIRSASLVPGRRRPSIRDTRCCTPTCSRGSRSAATRTLPISLTRPRSLRTRSTIITCSAASFSLASSSARAAAPGAAVPLIGSLATVAPVRRRYSSGENETMPRSPAANAAPWSGARTAAPRARTSSGWPVHAGLDRGRQVGLRQVAGGDALHARRHRLAVAGRARGAPAHVAQAGGAGLGGAPAEGRQPLAQGAGAGVGDERLEEPAPVRAQAQDVVVVGQLGRGREPGRRPRRHAGLQGAPVLVGDPAEPPAADGVPEPGARGAVEDRERPRSADHGQRLGGQDRAASGPAADERQRARLTAQRGGHPRPRGGGVGLPERLAHEAPRSEIGPVHAPEHPSPGDRVAPGHEHRWTRDRPRPRAARPARRERGGHPDAAARPAARGDRRAGARGARRTRPRRPPSERVRRRQPDMPSEAPV